jgi:preprotein translocase subunit SecA
MVEDQRKILYKRRSAILFGKEDNSFPFTQARKEYNRVLKYVDIDFLKRVERYISLFSIDRCWSEYIAYINDVREGIHLVNIGGRSPMEEFMRRLKDAFEELMLKINKEIEDTFKSIDFSVEGIDLSDIGIKRPASTWTYESTDNPFAADLGILLANDRNIGFTLGILLIWPIVLLGSIYTRIKRGKHI